MLPTDFRTLLLDTVAPELRERSMFSAGVIEAEKLQDMDDLIGQLLRGETDQATARTELKRRFGTLGEDVSETDLTDLRSDARLNLILDTNVQQAQGYGSWAQGQDEAILDQWPAQELFRAIQSRVPRDWSQRWADAGGRFYGGRMIALKNDPIWSAISRFGLPYPPFDFNSGMDVRDIDRDEAIALGLIDRDTKIPPQSRGFAADLAATPEVRASGLMKALQDQFKGAATFDGDGVFRLVAAANSADQPRDSLGRFSSVGGPGLQSRRNQASGIRAARKVAREGGRVEGAMRRTDLGDIDFDAGHVGDRSVDFKGGWGIDKIKEKHAGDVRDGYRRMAATIDHGVAYKHPSASHKVLLVHPQHDDIAVLSKVSGRQRWTVLSYHEHQNEAARLRKAGRIYK